jgi:hypothetical protein
LVTAFQCTSSKCTSLERTPLMCTLLECILLGGQIHIVWQFAVAMGVALLYERRLH